MSGSIERCHSEADVQAVYLAHYPVPNKKLLVLSIAMLLIFCSIVIATERVRTAFATVVIEFTTILLTLIFTILLLQLFLRKWWVPRSAKRIYAQQADLRAPFTWRWDDNWFHVSNANGETRFPWGDFYQWLRTEDMLLLYRSQVMFHFLPIKDEKARLAADDIASCLNNAGVKVKKRR